MAVWPPAPPLGGVDEAKSFCCEGGVKRRGLPLPLLVAAEGALRRGGGGGGVPGALLGPASLSSVLLLCLHRIEKKVEQVLQPPHVESLSRACPRW